MTQHLLKAYTTCTSRLVQLLIVIEVQIRRAFNAMESHLVRRTVIAAGPVLLVLFSLAHGVDWLVMHGMHDDWAAFLSYIVRIRKRWLVVHIIGLVVFPLLGVAVWLMLPQGRLSTRVSQAGLTAYIVLYAAFDAIAGIGSAVVAEYREGLPEGQRPLIDGVIWSLLGEATATRYLGELASAAWVLGALAGAVAITRQHGWGVGVPLALGGMVLYHSHFPPYGTVAGVLISVSAWLYLRRTRPDTVLSSGPAN